MMSLIITTFENTSQTYQQYYNNSTKYVTSVYITDMENKLDCQPWYVDEEFNRHKFSACWLWGSIMLSVFGCGNKAKTTKINMFIILAITLVFISVSM